MSDRSPLALHLPDADHLTEQEVRAALDLKPSAFLVLVYAAWDSDKGVAESTRQLVRTLGHNRLYVRFHGDPHPPGYAQRIGGATAWGRLCASRMTQYYGELEREGVQLHAILGNEVDADYEGGLNPSQASDFYRRAMTEYAAKRPQDILHVPAPTGAPSTHREHLEQFKRDGWVQPHWWIDGHGYNGDLENVIHTIRGVFPGHRYVITETNNLDDFTWPIALLDGGVVDDVVYFILNWAGGGEGRVRPPVPDDAAKRMSLLRFPDRYAQFKATIRSVDSPDSPGESQPEPEPEQPPSETPDEFPLPVDDQGREWKASTYLIRQAILDVAPREIDPNNPEEAIVLLLALAIAESGEDHQEQERWHIWTNHGVEAVRQRNLGYAAQVLGWGRGVGAIGTNDYSAGAFHQAMAWHDSFPGNPTDPNDMRRWDIGLWLNFRKLMIQDHGYATTYAARRIAAYYRQRPHDLQWCLERYNKPSEEVSPNIREHYRKALVRARELMGTVLTPEPPSDDTDVVYEAYPDPHPWGNFIRQPKGVILHGSRSGKASNPIAAEYAGTARYEQTNSFGAGSGWYKLGWNATIGDMRVALHLSARQWGNNARAASDDYLAVEFAQPTEDNQITEGQVIAFCDWFQRHVQTVWPSIPLYFPTHAEVERSGETGAIDGKTDVFRFGSSRTDELRERIMDRLGGSHPIPTPEPSEPETDEEKIRRMVSAIGYMGGDVADRIENSRASLDDGVSRPSDEMTRDEALANLRALWQNVDRVYGEIGAHGAELRRVRDEQLD